MAISHHHDSDVTYLRLESASLLRQLALNGLKIEQLRELQAAEAPPSLTQLISGFNEELIATTDIRKRNAIVDQFFVALGLQLLEMLKDQKGLRSSGTRHVTAAIERMTADLSASITLPQLAADLGLTPRAVQACFRSCIEISPMRWLKLARFSQLRQLLHCPDLVHLSYQALMSRVGLSSNTMNRQQYRDIYGLSPAEEQLRTDLQRDQRVKPNIHDSQYFHFSSIDAAIAALQDYQQRQAGSQSAADHPIQVTISVSTPQIGAVAEPKSSN